jgi:hypothetical protein
MNVHFEKDFRRLRHEMVESAIVARGVGSIGGRLVMPVGRDPKVQELVRITRISQNEYKREDLADVRFVPLIGEEAWASAEHETAAVHKGSQRDPGEEDCPCLRAVRNT